MNKLRATYEVDEIPEDELVSMLLENCVGKYNQYESHMIPRFFWLYSNIISLLRIKINDVYTRQPKPGQPSKGILISCIARCVLIAVYFGSLSCWNVQLLFWNSRFAYIDILRTAVRRYAALLFQNRNWIFQQDDDPKHTAVNTQLIAVVILLECPISVLEYSFRSIETIFNVLMCCGDS